MPYVEQPEEIVPGRPLFYATAMPQGGLAAPLLAENHMGRPTKIEGNPEHPASLGATNVLSQASVLTLYDPDRSRTVVERGNVRTWGDFTQALGLMVGPERTSGGTGLRLLTEPLSSPTLVDQVQTLLETFPQATWHQWDPVYGVAQGGVAPEAALYRFDRADVVVALDADFLGLGAGSVRYAKDFASRRRIGTPQDAMNRLYAAEPLPTVTGSNAEHRLPMKARDIHALAAAVAAGVGVTVPQGTLSDEASRWAAAVADDLKAHRGRSVVVRRRRPAGGGARAGARDQRRARQHRPDGALHHADRGVAARRHGVDRRSGGRR